MPACLIAQPIHPAATSHLAEQGIEVRQAGSSERKALAREIAGCAAVLTRNAPIDRSVMDAAGPALRVIAIHGTGSDAVEMAEASRRGIVVANTPGENARSVAEHAIALAFAVAKKTVAADAATRSGRYSFRYEPGLLELFERTFAIVGLGNIGRETARLARGLGMRVTAYSPSRSDADFERLGIERKASLADLLREADIVSLHTPLTAGTRKMIDASALSLMKGSAIVINTGRGGTLDEEALVAALRAGRLAGAGLDVVAHEPIAADHPLLSLPNVVLSPHIGGSTDAALRRTGLAAARIVIDVLAGRRPAHILNPQPWTFDR